MIIGNPEVFALESEQTDLFEGGPWLSNGTFFLHIGGRRFGSDNRGNTNMSIVLWGVERRLENRGKHDVLDYLPSMTPLTLAHIYEDAEYRGRPEPTDFDVVAAGALRQVLAWCEVGWSGRLGESMDDGSRILQLDHGDRVCVIGYRADHSQELGYVPESLRVQWLSSDDFYNLLAEWRQAFLSEYAALPKRPWPQDEMDPP